MKDLEKFYLNCGCTDDSHMLTIAFDLVEKEAMLGVQLNTSKNLFQRLAIAVKYVLGIKSKYGDGHWQESLLQKEQIFQLRELLNLFKLEIDAKESAGKIKKALDDIDSGKPNSAYKNLKGGSRKDILNDLDKKRNGTT